MLTIYRSTDKGLETVGEMAAGCWADAVNPTPEELRRLEAAGVPGSFFEHTLDQGERPRVERENDYTLIVLRLPYKHDRTAEVPFVTVPLSIIVSDRQIVTMCRVQENLAHTLLAGHPEKFSTNKPSQFLLRLFFGVAGMFQTKLAEINEKVESLEDRVTRSLQNREVSDLLRYQKSLTHFTLGLRGNKLMLERLQHDHVFKNAPEERELLEDVLIETEQALETTSLAADILSQMMDAFASIISNNLNVVMKFLAVVTVVLAVPTLISSLYGMNVGLPFEDSPYTFYIVVGLSAVISAVVLAWFRLKRWI
jgi:magnesium transporter